MRKIITPSELNYYSKSELSALFRKVSQDLAGTEPGSTKRRNTLASLENIQRAMNTRRTHQPKQPGL
ncbi:MAG: hypothetical protein ABW118_05825 [Candidatus Thiodiazotropha sp.]